MCRPRYSTWSRSASVIQLPSSCTRAAAEGPTPLAALRVKALGLTGAPLTGLDGACDLAPDRAELGIATDTLTPCRSPRPNQLPPLQKICGARRCSWSTMNG